MTAVATGADGTRSELASSTFTIDVQVIVRGGCASGAVPDAWFAILGVLLAPPYASSTIESMVSK